MGSNTSSIDHFLDIFSRYIDGGFGLISPDIGFLVAVCASPALSLPSP
jgi:type IV secretion system protein TrbL